MAVSFAKRLYVGSLLRSCGHILERHTIHASMAFGKHRRKGLLSCRAFQMPWKHEWYVSLVYVSLWYVSLWYVSLWYVSLVVYLTGSEKAGTATEDAPVEGRLNLGGKVSIGRWDGGDQRDQGGGARRAEKHGEG
jgi:hypothetical protein